MPLRTMSELNPGKEYNFHKNPGKLMITTPRVLAKLHWGVTAMGGKEPRTGGVRPIFKEAGLQFLHMIWGVAQKEPKLTHTHDGRVSI